MFLPRVLCVSYLCVLVCFESCVFRVLCVSINNFYVYSFYRNPGHDGSLHGCLLDSMARVQSVDDKAVFVFVSDAKLTTLSGWSQFLLLIDMT